MIIQKILFPIIWVSCTWNTGDGEKIDFYSFLQSGRWLKLFSMEIQSLIFFSDCEGGCGLRLCPYLALTGCRNQQFGKHNIFQLPSEKSEVLQWMWCWGTWKTHCCLLPNVIHKCTDTNTHITGTFSASSGTKVFSTSTGTKMCAGPTWTSLPT